MQRATTIIYSLGCLILWHILMCILVIVYVNMLLYFIFCHAFFYVATSFAVPKVLDTIELYFSLDILGYF